MNRRERAEREWEFTMALIAFVVLACLWEAMGVWYR